MVCTYDGWNYDDTVETLGEDYVQRYIQDTKEFREGVDRGVGRKEIRQQSHVRRVVANVPVRVLLYLSRHPNSFTTLNPTLTQTTTDPKKP